MKICGVDGKKEVWIEMNRDRLGPWPGGMAVGSPTQIGRTFDSIPVTTYEASENQRTGSLSDDINQYID